MGQHAVSAELQQVSTLGGGNYDQLLGVEPRPAVLQAGAVLLIRRVATQRAPGVPVQWLVAGKFLQLTGSQVDNLLRVKLSGQFRHHRGDVRPVLRHLRPRVDENAVHPIWCICAGVHPPKWDRQGDCRRPWIALMRRGDGDVVLKQVRVDARLPAQGLQLVVGLDRGNQLRRPAYLGGHKIPVGVDKPRLVRRPQIARRASHVLFACDEFGHVVQGAGENVYVGVASGGGAVERHAVPGGIGFRVLPEHPEERAQR